MSLPFSTQFLPTLTSMLSTRLRIDAYLENLVVFMSVSKNSKESRINRNELYNKIEEQEEIMKIFRFSILVQKCIVNGCVPDCEEIIEKLLKKCQTLVYQKSGMDESSFRFLKETIVQPYLHYLQKRANDEMDHHFEVEDNPELIKKENATQKLQEHISECYYLINLLNKSLKIGNGMMTLIRYFGGREGCILDFNICMGLDLEILYERLYESNKTIQFYLQNAVNRKLGEEEIKLIKGLNEMFKEIEKINEGLYIVYYNCYYYRSVEYLSPKYINSDKYLEIINKVTCLNCRIRKSVSLTEKSNLSDLSKSLIIYEKMNKKQSIKTEQPKENKTNISEAFIETKKSLDASTVDVSINESSENESEDDCNKNIKIKNNVSILLEISQTLNKLMEY